MSDHDRIKALVSLSASGDVSADELRLLREHLAECESCRRSNDDFASLSEALRAMPTPQPGPELLARVLVMADARLARRRSWYSDTKLLAPLVVFSWGVAIVTWPLMRGTGAWMLNWWQVPAKSLTAALTVYSVAGLLLAFAAVFAVAGYARLNGRMK
jgi:predicted anti-sigma-YlaC factor YlaD